ncbi:hypothetical protein BC835DRAFT_1359216 [Cytidiella melzeri]|nr:hypothetical protein BC835DRAFT_1359216 [Cytidiella melzeri]
MISPRSASPEAPALTGHNDLTEVNSTGGSSPHGARRLIRSQPHRGYSPNGAQRPHQRLQP